MTVVDKPLERMFYDICLNRIYRRDCIIPSKIPSSQNRIPEDLWRFVLDEGGYGDFLEGPFLVDVARRKPNMKFVVGWAIENAFLRGNKNNPDLEVSVRYFLGERGSIVSVIDSGEGFDFKGVQRKYLARDSSYKQRNGAAFIGYNWNDFEVSFENRGSRVNIMGRN